jgi:hypothetical protein
MKKGYIAGRYFAQAINSLTPIGAYMRQLFLTSFVIA